jgi:signal transduction histidine kinase/DNA-binding response OmpR family regulator
MQFDPSTGSFLRYRGIRTECAWHVMRDRQGRIWAGDDLNGFHVIHPHSGTVDRFTNDPSNPRSLSHDRARVSYQDPSGRIWVGAGIVINLWDSVSGTFTRYQNPAFARALAAVPLGSDTRGRLWVGYLGFGLGILDVATGSFTNLDASDGLCGNLREMEVLEDGQVVLTGSTGLNVVSPDSIELIRTPPPLTLTRVSVNDDEVYVPADRGGPARLDLTHAQNVIEFEFAAIDIDAPGLVQYQYMLEGLESDWVETETRRFVRYTALPPGDYTFRVRAASAREEWPQQELAIAVSIAPPWWQTAWAYAAYVLLICGVLFSVYRLRMRDLRLRQRAEIEHLQAEHLSEVDRLKSRFFANISHEFRTPLTLILGPIRKWQEQASDEAQRRDLAMAERNAHRLMQLINQLLDLSKLDAGAMKLKAASRNIVPLVKGIANSFESSAGMRDITLAVRADRDVIDVWCDRDMIEKVLSNLLSNAFKFTPAGGTVSVSVRAQLSNPDQGPRTDSNPSSGDGSLSPSGAVEIVVSDTGIGIPPDEMARVFDRFYQVDASQTREHEGSGIGLALVKELVDLHHGTISVQSEVGKGTSFTFRLPLGRAHLKEEEILEAAAGEPPTASVSVPDLAGLAPAEDPTTVTRSGAQRSQAPTNDGRRPTLEAVPDLVISDVMMPKKDGYEVCRALKLDERTNHVPLILLTAKAGVENKIEGLEIGADDYVVKPFEPKELLARARNLITLRRSLREKFTTAVPLRPGEIAVPSMGEAFLERVRASVERHIGEEGFSVEDLSKDVGLSRSQVLRKLTELTGMSVRDFIRYIRLHRAMDLLKQGAGTVSEIAYIVGFSSPAHFTKCFHELFGTVPSEVRRAKS